MGKFLFKTIEQEITSGSLANISDFLNDVETRENNGDHHLIYIFTRDNICRMKNDGQCSHHEKIDVVLLMES